ncbi:g-type lectin s-receptor-like serine/threonine-protein kinase [Quercus suber]|uniref:G-type lectin s-receptor-like serine/threonine-protein kinase n=1 Tax=Quercus suber TaxID=58331 RepID=A0AAW0L4D7_QUESU
MATIFLFLLLSAIFTAKARPGQSNIEPGSFITATPSPSSLYGFGFYKQGNGYAIGICIEGIPQKTVVWTTNRDNPPVPKEAILNFTSNGQLVLQSAQGTQTSIANSPGGATSASMLDSSNFVFFDHPTDTHLPNQHLSIEKTQTIQLVIFALNATRWISCDVPVGTPYTIDYGYWNYKTPGQANNVRLNLDDHGHLYLDSGNGMTGIMDLNLGDNPTKVLLYLLRIDVDGILRLYSHNMDQNGYKKNFTAESCKASLHIPWRQ